MASSLPHSPGRIGRFFGALSTQKRVIGALFLRELHSRYGRDNIGYLWLIAEPMMLASVITLLHANAPTHFGSDIGPVPFTIIGYTIFIVFRGIFSRADGAVESNQMLLHHRMVTITDIMLARAMLEIGGCFITMCILMSLAISLGYADWPERPLHLLAAYAQMGWWSVALAFIVVGVTYGNETLARFTHPIAYFCVPLSGAFYQLEWIPESFRKYLLWWPMALICEQARYGQFRSATSEYMDVGYVAIVCTLLTYCGLLLVRRLRRRVHVH
ncbi:ABC transporter [Sphingomonas sp. Leaf17]|uniref:ABC transporter permease n=1 Tax=Sphingomonas sp. Leaf17 TaxID=1735683 RepID=UPI0006F27CCB|nr:ABC transporter permease [Sphingomonas sp. Leaf17]KQM67800.1 ABC transporter [Sphingomonas sp. Leaf17]